MSDLPAHPALLLLGPTGSGKSPVGRALARHAGWFHLDFGAHLRQIAAGSDRHGLDVADAGFVYRLVETNALFPDDALPLVRRIAAAAIRGCDARAVVVLNGLPRTLAQAEGLAGLFDVRCVAVLDCSPEIVAERVARRHAALTSDDAGRADDTPDQVARKLAAFESATRPLIDHYRARGAAVTALDVGIDSKDAAVARAICLGWPG